MIILELQVIYGKADISLEQFRYLDPRLGDMSASTSFRKTIYFELKPKEFSKFTNIVYCFDGITWLSFLVSFILLSFALSLSENMFLGERKTSSVSIT